MSANARINHESEFGQHENAVAFGSVQQADADNPANLALLVARYGLFNIEGIPKQDKVQLLTLLKQKAEIGKDSAIDTEDVTQYRNFASVTKMADFHLSDYEKDPGNELWDKFQELVQAGSVQEQARLHHEPSTPE